LLHFATAVSITVGCVLFWYGDLSSAYITAPSWDTARKRSLSAAETSEWYNNKTRR